MAKTPLKNILNIFSNTKQFINKLVSLDAFTSKEYGVSDLLIYDKFVASGIILNTDGSLLTSLWFRGQDLDSSTDDDLSYLSQYINMAMCKLGTGWTVHLDCIRSESSGYIDPEECHFTDAASYIIDEERRFEYNLEDTHYENNYVMNFTWLPPADFESRIGLVFLQAEEKTKGKHVDYSKYLAVFREQVLDVIGILETKFKISQMTDDEMLSYLNYCVTGNWLELHNPVEHFTEISYIVANQDLINGFDPKVGEKFVRAISLGENFPAKSFPTMLKQLNDLGFCYRWNTRYIFLDKAHAEKMIAKIADLHFQKRKSAGSMATEHFGGDASHKVNRSADTYFEDAEEARELSEIGGIRFGKYTSSIIIYEEDQIALAEKTKIVKNLINNLNLIARVEKAHCLEAFLGSLPSMVRPNIRKWIMHSTNLADLMPTTSTWAGFNENPCRYYQEAKNAPPLFYASTTGNTPFRVCLHNGDVGHGLILGNGDQTKILNFIATQHTRYKNAKVFYFDNGHGSLPLCYSMNGTHYDIGSEHENISFKPLEFLDKSEDFSFVSDWLVEICLLNGFKIQSNHRTIITDVLGIIRDEGSSEQRTMSYFQYQISSKDEELAEVFKPYTTIGGGGGLQSTIFDAKKDNLTFSTFTVFELQHLIKKGDETLIPAIRYLFHMIERNADGSPILILLAQAWSVLKNKVFQSIVGEWLRKIGRLNVAILLASTQLSDILNSEIFDVLIDNCKTNFLMPNPEAQKPNIAKIYEQYGLNEKQISLIANGIPQREYYYMSSLGSRMFNLALGEITLAFIGYSSVEDIAIARDLKVQHGNKFAYYWLNRFNLSKVQQLWLNKHNQLIENKGAPQNV